MRQMEKTVALWVLDSRWKEHLLIMDSLKEGIHLRGYAHTDPLVEYQKEAYLAYQDMLSSLKEAIVDFIFKTKITFPKEAAGVFVQSPQREVHSQYSPLQRREEKETASVSQKVISPSGVQHKGKKVGRNEPCPCGSGKKYKKCCGR